MPMLVGCFCTSRRAANTGAWTTAIPTSEALGGSYDRTQFMAERAKMMQAWADYLDGLRQGADVLPFKRRTK